jgi:hypothetical protein
VSIITIVTTTAQFLAALSTSQAGDTIELAPGTYSNVVINNKNISQTPSTPGGATRVLIESQNSSNPAILTDLDVNSSTGFYFQNLTLSTASTPVGPGGGDITDPFRVSQSSQMTFKTVTVIGDPTGTYSTDVSGLLIENSTHLGIQNSTFAYLHNGFSEIGDNYVTVSGNNFSNISDDGIRGGGTSNVTITGNTFTTQHVDASDPTHPDAIQFWTTNTTAGASNITITNNTISRGAGNAVQGIFLNDEMGNRPYTNVTIQGNSLTGELYNGILVDDGISTTISGNNVVSLPDYVSSIRVYNSLNPIVSYNTAGGYSYSGDTNLQQWSNTISVTQAFPNTYLAPGGDGVADEDPGGSLTSPAAVPEPSIWWMMFVAIGVCGAVLRRRRSRARGIAFG